MSSQYFTGVTAVWSSIKGTNLLFLLLRMLHCYCNDRELHCASGEERGIVQLREWCTLFVVYANQVQASPAGCLTAEVPVPALLSAVLLTLQVL